PRPGLSRPARDTSRDLSRGHRRPQRPDPLDFPLAKLGVNPPPHQPIGNPLSVILPLIGVLPIRHLPVVDFVGRHDDASITDAETETVCPRRPELDKVRELVYSVPTKEITHFSDH